MNTNISSHMYDFTIIEYEALLRLAKARYAFIGYQEISSIDRFILWRHDCDYSLNRAVRLAQIEHKESIKATYFLNVHCEFYNLLEKEQSKIIGQILELGHDIGLHFDAAFYDIKSEGLLDDLVAREASWFNAWFGVKISAFSFHNPTQFLLSCERDSYGGLINCYSQTFKTKIPYCSDSNGYWRYRRLRDVLENSQEYCLQVLTHPGWWQDEIMPPRQRILRCINGRAKKTIERYDRMLNEFGRENVNK